MNLRFVWVIFRKDARRVWWMIALTVALLSRVVYFDSGRSGAGVGSEESWLNLVLPLVWSFLIALAVLEDPVVNDGPFWVTVPCRWQSVLTAKAAFAVVFVHLPYLVACAVIVHARGFAPSEHLSVLLGGQLTPLAVTLPAIALATLVGNVTQFMTIAIVLGTAVGAPSLSAYFTDSPATRLIRDSLVFFIAAAAALWIAVWQYGRRRTVHARAVGAAAILIAAAIWWLPRERFDTIQAYLSPSTAAAPSIRLAGPGEPSEQGQGFNLAGVPGGIRIAIPLTVSGVTTGHAAHFRQSEVQLRDSAGDSYAATVFGPGQLTAGLQRNPDELPTWQLMNFGPAIFARVRDLTVSVDATALVTHYRMADPVWTSVDRKITIAGLGKCSSEVVGDNPNDEQLKVSCEVPGLLPMVHVRLLDPATGREWNRTLGGAVGPWFSPVDRAESYFALTDEEHYKPFGGQWQVPREIMPAVRISLAAEIPEGSSVVSYELPNIKLPQYQVK